MTSPSSPPPSPAEAPDVRCRGCGEPLVDRGDGGCALCGFGQSALGITRVGPQAALLAEPAPAGWLRMATGPELDELRASAPREPGFVIHEAVVRDGVLRVPTEPPFPCEVFVVTAEPGHEASLLVGVRRSLVAAQELWAERAAEAARRRHRAVAPFEWSDIGEEPETGWLTTTDDADGVAGCIERVVLP